MRRKQIVLNKNWRNYINKHPNSKWLVCGIGPSIKEINLDKYKDHLLIGVNDIEIINKYRNGVLLSCMNSVKHQYTEQLKSKSRNVRNCNAVTLH